MSYTKDDISFIEITFTEPLNCEGTITHKVSAVEQAINYLETFSTEIQQCDTGTTFNGVYTW